jgi:hypothetical protein
VKTEPLDAIRESNDYTVRARVAMPWAMLPAPMMVICMVNLPTAVPEDPRPTQPVRPLPGCAGRVR